MTEVKLYPIPELYKGDRPYHINDVEEFNEWLKDREHYDGLPRQCDHCGGGMCEGYFHDECWYCCSMECFKEHVVEAYAEQPDEDNITLEQAEEKINKVLAHYDAYEWEDNPAGYWALRKGGPNGGGHITEFELGIIGGVYWTDWECYEDAYNEL